MTTPDSSIVLNLYRADIRSFLEENAVGDLTALDQTAELLEKALKRSETLSIGFVGEAQVDDHD